MEKKIILFLFFIFNTIILSSCSSAEESIFDVDIIQTDSSSVVIENHFLQGKTFSVLGNSISTYSGHISVGFRNYYSSKHFDVKDTWWMQFATITGAELLSNASWSGSTVTYTGKDNVNSYFYSNVRIDSLGHNGVPDIIFVIGGTNDWKLHPSELGKYPSVDTLTFVGAYTTMVERMKSKYKQSTIVLSSILPRMEGLDSKNSKGWSISKANSCIEKIAKDYNCLYVNMDKCGIDNPSGKYMFDSVHPNALGMILIANSFAGFLLENNSL